MRSLGGFYSRTLHVDGGRQIVVESGPYRLIRHPGYAGSLLVWIGFALTSGSPPVVAAVAGLLGRAYQQRIKTEEALLSRRLPGYTDYRARTKKLIPYIW
jgi:protein-S-isoprenylcysteine O-methyltransferase Ste14